MKYYKDINGDLYADPSDNLIQSLGLVEELSPIKNDGMVLPNHKNIGLLPTDDLGNLYKYYIKDSDGNYIPDFDRIMQEDKENLINATEGAIQKLLDDTARENGGWDSMLSARGANVPILDTDSDAVKAMKTNAKELSDYYFAVWEKAYEIQADAEANGTIPTTEEVLEQLPTFGA